MTGNDDRGRLEQFIDRALFWCREPLDNEQGSVTESIEYALSMPFSGNATQVRPLLHELEKQLDEPDATRVDGILRGLMRFGQAEGAMVLTPRLPGLYPDPAKKFLFHVTKFKGENDWPDTMRERTRAACTQAGINYERGDEQLKPRVITNIWNSICSATHVLVDLTGWSPNVTCELGMAHALRRDALVIGQENVQEKLFEMIARINVHSYSMDDLDDYLKLINRYCKKSKN